MAKKVDRLKDANGKPATLQLGNCIGFIETEQLIQIFVDDVSSDCLRWPYDDDKHLVQFIKNGIEFCKLVEIIALMHGFSFVELPRRSYGPIYKFIKED